MAFVVEDGTGLSTATSYVSVADADTYHSDRGNTTWAGADDIAKQRALICAADYVDKRFGRKFRGFRLSKDQGLQWPRLSAFDSDGYLFPEIPNQLKKAIYEYAVRAITAALVTDPSSTTSGVIKSERKKVGPIEKETEYMSVQSTSAKSSLVSDGVIPEYPAADLWLEELVENSMGRRLARA